MRPTRLNVVHQEPPHAIHFFLAPSRQQAPHSSGNTRRARLYLCLDRALSVDHRDQRTGLEQRHLFGVGVLLGDRLTRSASAEY